MRTLTHLSLFSGIGGAGPGGGGRGVPDHRSMRMGRLPLQGSEKALAGGSPLAGYPDTDKGELL